MVERAQTQLTPDQAADVIRYYDKSENARSLERGWKRKVPLACVAIHAAMKNYSILPSGEALLSFDEVRAGLDRLDHLDHHETESVGGWPVEPTDEQWECIERIVDTKYISYDQAYAEVMGIYPSSWR